VLRASAFARAAVCLGAKESLHAASVGICASSKAQKTPVSKNTSDQGDLKSQLRPPGF
jgi:hypothetical protein